MPILETKNLIKIYNIGEVETRAVNGITLSIEKGEFIAIIGPSGSGKSTLMYQLSLLDDPTSGKVKIEGKDATKFSAKEKESIRLNKFGFVFQEYALLPELTAFENVLLPLYMKGGVRSEDRKIAEKALIDVQLGDKLKNRPSQLSGGEQQRVGIARALVNNPEVLFADEPTANLDSVSGGVIINILKKLNKEGLTVVMVTHESQYAKAAKRRITLHDGKVSH